jgi:hypothetical protein
MTSKNTKESNKMQATITFSKTLNKYTAIVGNKVVAKATDKYYLRNRVAQLGYTLDAAPAAPMADVLPQQSDKFTINQRFDFVSQMITMVSDQTIASAVITGQGGLGKTHSVMKALDRAGLVNTTDLASFEVGTLINASKAFRVIKGFSTAKGLYRTLFEGNGMTLVFDDCDSVLKDPIALNLLKGALDSYSDRYLSWNADMRDEDLPRSFTFTGSVIFISNMKLDDINQAVRSRAMCVDLSMTEAQKIERMEVMIQDPEFLPEFTLEAKTDAVAFIKSILDQVSNLSLRSLIATTKIAAKGGKDWRALAEYVLTQGA